MKRILFVDHHAELGGGEIALLEIIKNLNRSKFSLSAYLGDEGPLRDELKKLNVEVVVDKLPDYFRQLDRDPNTRNRPSAFVKSVFSLSGFGKKIKALIVEKGIDTVYINSIKSLLYTTYAAKSTKCKIIWHLHDCLCSDFYSRWAIPIIILLSRKVDYVICVSHTVKDYFIKASGDAKKAVVIYNGVDINRFNPNIPSESIKKELNLSGQKTVSIIGRLEPWKGQRVFINAAKRICDSRDDVIFLIVGGALFGFVEYEKELKAMVEQLGLKNRVLLLGFRNGIEKIYAASDIITHCSIRPEPFGRDIIEAMACAKPVISTGIGAPKEIIIDKKDGILVKPTTPELLASEISRLIDNPQMIKTLGENARKKAEGLFNITEVTERIEQLT